MFMGPFWIKILGSCKPIIRLLIQMHVSWKLQPCYYVTREEIDTAHEPTQTSTTQIAQGSTHTGSSQTLQPHPRTHTAFCAALRAGVA